MINPRAVLLTAVCSFILFPPASGQTSNPDSTGLSLEDLLNLPVSSAAKYLQNSADAPASITILTGEEIRRYGFRNLAEALQAVSSFSIGTDHSYTNAGVRGFARSADYNNRILVLQDGHVFNETSLGAADISGQWTVDLSEIDRVEVVRGPGSALYGARAMFAVVNVITRKGSDIDGTSVWAEAGSFRSRNYGLQMGKTFGNGLDVAISGGWAETDGEDLYYPEFDSPASNQGIAEGLNWGEMVRGRASVQHRNLKVWGSAYHRIRGVPSAPFHSAFADPRSEVEDTRWALDLQYVRAVSTDLDLTFRGYADYLGTTQTYPQTESNLLSLDLGATWGGAEARMRWDVRPEHRLVAGAEYQWTPGSEVKLDAGSEEGGFQGDFPYTISSVFLQDEFQVTQNLALTGGVRHDRFSSTASATTPRFAVVYHPWAQTTIKALWGTAFRPANIYERELESSYALHLANPDLDPERIRSSEIVLEHRFSGVVAARVGVFQNDVEHLIDQQPVPVPEDWPASSFGNLFALQFQNGDEIRARGVEMEMNLATNSGTFGYVRYGLQKVEDRSTGAEAPNYPVHSLKLGGTVWVEGAVSLGANFLWESERMTLGGSRTDPFQMLDLSLSSKPFFHGMTVSLSAKNLLDTEYSLPGGPQHSLVAIPQPGRTLHLRVGVGW